MVSGLRRSGPSSSVAAVRRRRTSVLGARRIETVRLVLRPSGVVSAGSGCRCCRPVISQETGGFLSSQTSNSRTVLPKSGEASPMSRPLSWDTHIDLVRDDRRDDYRVAWVRSISSNWSGEASGSVQSDAPGGSRIARAQRGTRTVSAGPVPVARSGERRPRRAPLRHEGNASRLGFDSALWDPRVLAAARMVGSPDASAIRIAVSAAPRGSPPRPAGGARSAGSREGVGFGNGLARDRCHP